MEDKKIEDIIKEKNKNKIELINVLGNVENFIFLYFNTNKNTLIIIITLLKALKTGINNVNKRKNNIILFFNIYLTYLLCVLFL